MKPTAKFRKNFLLLVLVVNIVPAVVALGFYLILTGTLGIDQTTAIISSALLGIALAMGALAIIFIAYSNAVHKLYQHLVELSKNNDSYRTKFNGTGLFSTSAKMLNNVSERLQRFESATKTESDVIQAETKRLRSVLNSIKDGVFALDKDGYIVLFNKAAEHITGFSLAEAAGKPVSHIVPMMRGNELILSEWLNTVSGQAYVEQHWENIRLRTEDGGQKVVNVDALYQGADPNGIRTLVTFNDRTEAQQVEDMKLDFVALAAHELRTPITVIKGYVEILEDELAGGATPKQKDFFHKLDVSATQLSAIINNILHVSRIEHGNLNLKPEPADWPELVKQVAQQSAAKAKASNKKIIFKVTGKIPSVNVDKMSIAEVITNLIDNAIKYSPGGKDVTVSIRLNNNNVETSVNDHGAGIPANDLDKLFVKFYRSHHTRGSHAGTGLGLYMCKGIVEAHGGSIWVSSKEGEGSTFGFTLPLTGKVAGSSKAVNNSNKVMRGVHGWIKNHSLYRG